VHSAKDDGCANAQSSSRLGLELRNRDPGIFHLVNDTRRMLNVELACVGKAHWPRRAIEQPNTERFFEPVDLSRY
jgi:hypothetical protein